MTAWRVATGDVSAIIPTLDAASFDAVLCDPPYGLSFMGKAWDHGVPSAEVWGEVLRVVKPGAHLLAFGGTRTFHRLTCAIEDAGFEIRDCLSWLYGQGFPKSLDISKALDKAANAERPVVGVKRTGPGCAFNSDGPTELPITGPATAAAAWAGYGTALKPAWEPCVVAMKPCDGTFAENALAHGVAGLNIDECRIATADPLGGGAELDRQSNKPEGWDRPWRNDPDAQAAHAARIRENVKRAESLGRWPANVAFDEEAAAMLDEQSGDCSSTRANGNPRNGMSRTQHSQFWRHPPGDTLIDYRDSGGASRFFYVAKASRGEREAGLREAGLREAGGIRTNAPRDCEADKHPRVLNGHPTVKPIKLCEYLARLILPPKRDTPRRLLVPFSGSGSEMIGALLAGWDEVVGIEREAEYVEIAEARLQHWVDKAAPLFAEEKTA